MPQRAWLRRYAEVFATVEVNNTFYRLPSRDAVSAWVEQTPTDFLFSVKVSRYLTHVKRLRELGPGLRRFLERIEPLCQSGKLAALLWQLPANVHRDDERLRQALAAASERAPGRHAFEFRHESWFCPEVLDLLRERGAALVIADTPERPFQARELTADWTFLRFHHGRRGRGGNYSRRELEEWAARIADWSSRADVLAYFNNDWKAYAVRNARDLARVLERERARD